MARGGLWWIALAGVLWGARAGPGPPEPAPAAPDWRFPYELYNLTIPENSAPRTAARPPAGAPAAWLPAPPGAHVRFRVRHGDKERFFKAEELAAGERVYCVLRARAGHVLNRERRADYRLTLRASAALPGGARLEADTTLALAVADVNDLAPLFYPTDYDVEVAEDAPPHASVAKVSAEDADLGLNGEIYYSFLESTDQFAVHVTSGVVSITRPLRREEKQEHQLTVVAQDRASLLARGADAPAARARLTVRVRAANLHAPELRARAMPDVAEDGAPAVYAIVHATDRDEGEHGRVAAVDIVDGDPDGHFRVRPSATAGEWDVIVHPLLDRAAPRGYNLTLRAVDAGTPPRAAYLALPVHLAPPREHAPVFSRALYEVRVSETAPPRTPLVRLKMAERRDPRVYIEIVGGNEGGEFLVEPESGVLYTRAPLDAERRALHVLTVAALGAPGVAAGTRDQSSAKVQVTVLDANDNDPVFETEDLTVEVPENTPAGGVLARVLARDADSGENGYVSYSIANLQAVPFDVEHFSGVVRATRTLDYESMRREWVLRVRASDWGLPYRRQAELRLTVRVRDVNDNRPQFERRDCVGYVPRSAAPGRALHTLSAIDFDVGDVVSYRIAGGNDDGCFALDSGTGVLSVACDLSTVREETRVLNVTATDGTHFADPAALTLHLTAGGDGAAPAQLECRDAGVARRLTELLAAAERANAPADPADEFPPAPTHYGDNLHAPEFLDFPVEVKVNESVALGTKLLCLHARDRDRGYNGLLVYAISDGDVDSAFRLDPETGELTVIGYLDHEREREYFLNVTVRDLGAPARAASRLLPVTVLDVNDHAPRFERALAALRVTENALNGTEIFQARASDEDSGVFGEITYSLRGASGEFCIDSSGLVRVCAPLDRERRALYELTLLATDGGGLAGEARVRVTVDDVNDVAPAFSQAGYSARVREDVPRGTLVAQLQAADPDSGAGGRVRYSLPEQDEDAAFTLDELSGALRTARTLDYEDRQVYGVTVRATDGGTPPLWSDVTLIVELLDVDENAHAPHFAAELLAGSVPEGAPPGRAVLAAAAKDADPPGRDSRLHYYILDGSGMGYFSIDDTGVIHTLAPLDRETQESYWLTVCAEDAGLAPRAACVPVHVAVEDVNDEAPWPAAPQLRAALPEHCAAGTRVAHVRAVDRDLNSSVAYRIVAGNPDGLFTVDEQTGVVTTTGRTLDREAAAAHALEVRASDGALGASARVLVQLLDVNDHAPAFTQRFYQLRVPVPEDSNEVSSSGLGSQPGESSAEREAEAEAEADSDDEDEGSGARAAWDHWEGDPPLELYVGSVLALDGDLGANGSVRYSARARPAPARPALRVHARSGRLYLAAPLRPGHLLDLTVRACDGGAPARCGAARVAVRGAAAGGGAPPRAPAPAALAAAELDAPGFLLQLLQASDPDGDPLYYDIVDGDPSGSFQVGREDGSLVLARRLRWEVAPRHALNVSVSDGLHTVYTSVNITVVNDLNEGGLSFTRDEYIVDVSEDAHVGSALLALRAISGDGGDPGGVAGDARVAGGDAGGPSARILYGLLEARAPASLPLFHLDELTGVLELRQPLDRETAALHELTVWARDGALRAARAWARVSVRVHDVDEHAPAWGRPLAEARVPLRAPVGQQVVCLRASDADGDALTYSLAGGDAAGAFAVDAARGCVRVARPLRARDYTLQLRAQGPPPLLRRAALPLHLTVVEPDDHPPQFTESHYVWEVFENEPAGTAVGSVEARAASSVSYALLGGGGGLLALRPLAGDLVTLAPLDYETQPLYNLTVVATSLGGGTATAQVTLHVLDRNEHAPRLTARQYRGRVSEAAPPGALVARADADAPLALTAVDEDSPAHRQRAYDISPPAAAAAFRVHAATGALSLARPLDYETQKRWEFTVRVLDMGEPRLPSDSAATVIVDVEDVNDCAPQFEQAEYAATLLVPTVVGALAARLAARDDDTPPERLKYDILEGDPDGHLALAAGGALLVARPDDLRPDYRLRVRVSDGALAATARVRVRVRAPEPAGLAFQKTDYYGSVLENSTKATTVAVLSVLGAALGEHVEFSLLNPGDGFTVGATSGAVVSTQPLDRERAASHTLLLAAAAGARAATARLHVAVGDVNDNCPVFVRRPYRAAVRAGAPAGTELVRVRAVDLDDNDNGEVRYEMKRGHGELFRVERRSGAVSLRQPLDARQELYDLVVAAFDGGTPACGTETAVSVRVWGGGGAPGWPDAHVRLAAREDVPRGAVLAALRADSPLQRQLIYTLLRPEDHPELELHFDTGSLVAAAELDAERAAELQFTVRATDGVTGAHADVDVTLTVTDVNDCEPRFARDTYRADVSEAASVGTLLLTVHATDNDTGLNGEVVYSLTGDWNDTQPLFSVEPKSGSVRVAAPLDRERRAAHVVTLVATDRGAPPQRSAARLLVTVLDVNDCAPRLERAVLAAALAADAARGTPVAAVRAWDPDAADEGHLRYALETLDPHHTFSVDPRSGVVALANTRAWAAAVAAAAGPDAAPITLNVSVSDGAHAVYARLKIAPVPINAHAPRFQHLLHEARALENQPAGLLLTTVVALDADAGELGAVSYSLPSARLRAVFAVDARSGALRTRAPLDREARAEWLVPLLAHDGGGRVAHTSVRVRVADLNDNAPEFPHLEYGAAVEPDRAAPFLALEALDDDEGANARLRYSLYEREDLLAPAPEGGAGEPGTAAEADARGLFKIDPDSGALSLARNATEFEGRTLRVWVRATDGGGRAGEAPVRVRVLSRGAPRPAPPPLPPAIFLPEDAPLGTLLAELPPAAGIDRWRLAGGRWARGQFALAGARLLLAAPLAGRARAPLRLALLGEVASGAPAATLPLALHVLDVNDHAPAFHSEPYVLHLAEDTPPHTSVLQVMADDEDAGSNGEVRYSFGDEPEAAESVALFALEPHTGWLVLAAPLDRERAPEHRLPLLAADQGAAPRVTRGSLVLRLRDVNDNPPAFERRAWRLQVREDAAPGDTLLRLRARDPDLPAPHALAYFVSGGDPGARFQLRAPGDLLLARALDREAQALHELEVTVSDGRFSDTARVVVEVLDVDDNPPVCARPRYEAALPEDAAAGAAVLTVEAADADEPEHARLRYYLTGDGAEHFAVHEDAGRVTVAAPLDRETRARYRLTAHAQARGRPDWECRSELLISLTDVNDNAPRFSAARYSVTLPEDAEPGTLVCKLHAADADEGANRLVRYSPEDADADAGVFRLDADTGIVTLAAALDREAAPLHRLRVVAADRGRPALVARAELLLTVADVNDNPPEFELRVYSASVPELDAVGTEVARLHAMSKDTGVNADVYYSIVGGDARDDFRVDRVTGVVSVARPLDYERTRLYALTVQALDGGSPPLSDHALLNVSVVDCNDNAPVFTQPAYSAQLREDAPVGALVLAVLALDADAGDNGRVAYDIARGDPAGLFTVDARSGAVSLAAPLDRETAASHELELRATDAGEPPLVARATLHVAVLDANDNPPLLERTEFSLALQEDRPPGHALLRLRVTDADAPPNGAPFTFDFQSGNEARAFRLEQDGVLRTAAHFNRRARDSYELQLRVFDNGSPPLFADARVHVRVVEQSQYPPAVTPLDVQVVWFEDDFPGGALGRVRAVDRDQYDTLTYELTPASALFQIDARSGELRAVPALEPGEYSLNVTVGDGRFFTAALVRVRVLRVTEAMLAHAVVVRFREVSPADFVLAHRKGFVRAVSEAMQCELADVSILSVQAGGGEADGEEDGEKGEERTRRRRQVAADLDVLFCVRAGAGWAAGEALRRRLHAQLERLEERARLVVEELVRAPCGGCAHGACAERAELRAPLRVLASDVFALAAPGHRLRAACACEPGWGGARCEAPLATAAEAAAALAGDGYALFALSPGALGAAGERQPADELTLSLRFRTLSPAGVLAYVAGPYDYLVLEIVDGYLQVRMELGGGEAVARADAAFVSDGGWHAARLERRGGAARLSVGRAGARAAVPPPHAVLDAPPELYIGAALRRLAHANAPLQVTEGFVGCIADLRLSGEPLPLHEGGGGRAQLLRRVRVRAGACERAPPAPPCAAHPCRNGGTCIDESPVDAGANASSYRCSCHARFSGARCERDDDPCAARPCLHGGQCAAARDPPGYSCACAPPARGQRCQLGYYCDRPGACGHGGACEEGVAGASCRCRGYYGPACQHDVDECAGEPCGEGATCLNEPGSFRCVCPPGRTGAPCGPLHSGAVLASGGGGGAGAAARLWHWLGARGWAAAAAGAAALLLLVALALLPLLCRRGAPAPPAAAVAAPHKPVKLSNLAAARERPAACACACAPLNNADSLLRYGAAGDELERPSYARNLHAPERGDRKPWSEQMHLHSFSDHKIYNDLKGTKSTRPPSPGGLARPVPPCAPGPGPGAGAGGDLVGGYHWDCSDWCGGALPAISELTANERRDSTSPGSERARASPASPATTAAAAAARKRARVSASQIDTSSGLDEEETRYDFTDAESYLLHPDAYLPREGEEDGVGEGEGDGTLRALRLREPDAASLITMLEERAGLLPRGGGGSAGDVSTRLCEIEDSDVESDPPAPAPCRHTDV